MYGPHSIGEILVYRAALEASPREFVKVARAVGIDPVAAADAFDLTDYDGAARRRLERLQNYVRRPGWRRVFG